MRGSLGEKIGEGATADIHVWAPGQIVKLFKVGASPRFGPHEARMTRAAFAGGGPAPEVFDEVTLEGRFGIVLPRFKRVAVLRDPVLAVGAGQFGAVQTMASSLGVEPRPIDVRDGGEIERAIATFRANSQWRHDRDWKRVGCRSS
jgi:hypothetical protein